MSSAPQCGLTDHHRQLERAACAPGPRGRRACVCSSLGDDTALAPRSPWERGRARRGLCRATGPFGDPYADLGRTFGNSHRRAPLSSPLAHQPTLDPGAHSPSRAPCLALLIESSVLTRWVLPSMCRPLHPQQQPPPTWSAPSSRTSTSLVRRLPSTAQHLVARQHADLVTA